MSHEQVDGYLSTARTLLGDKQQKKALKYLEAAVESAKSAEVCKRAGDALFQTQFFEAAAEYYANANKYGASDELKVQILTQRGLALARVIAKVGNIRTPLLSTQARFGSDSNDLEYISKAPANLEAKINDLHKRAVQGLKYAPSYTLETARDASCSGGKKYSLSKRSISDIPLSDIFLAIWYRDGKIRREPLGYDHMINNELIPYVQAILSDDKKFGELADRYIREHERYHFHWNKSAEVRAAESAVLAHLQSLVNKYVQGAESAVEELNSCLRLRKKVEAARPEMLASFAAALAVSPGNKAVLKAKQTALAAIAPKAKPAVVIAEIVA